jgi:leucyl aminopeptidase
VLKLDSDPVRICGDDEREAAVVAHPVTRLDLERDEAVSGLPAGSLRRAGFRAAVGEAMAVADGAAVRLAFGVGARGGPDALRLGAMEVGRRVADGDLVAIDVTRFAVAEQAVHAAAAVEGAILGSYRWTPPRGPEPSGPALRVDVDSSMREAAAEACRRAAVRARAANWARRLTDTPPADLTPPALAQLAQELATAYRWEAASIAGDDLLDAGLGAIHAIGRGSINAPQLIDLTYRGRGDGPVDVVLVGKGVTMDCGGLNLKTNRPVAAVMKTDMAGGASVLAALAAATTLELPVNVRVLVPAAENLVGPGALLPGDVVEHCNGRRTEVVLTDAEGRLLLADSLAYAAQAAGGAVLIDVGTLSEAPFAPVGWTVISRHAWLTESLASAARATGELGVQIPLVDGYDEWITSPVADSKNFSYAHPSQDLMVVGAFLEPFVAGRAWAHIDTVGVANLTYPWMTWPPGATGSPTRPLVELLAAWDGVCAEVAR